MHKIYLYDTDQKYMERFTRYLETRGPGGIRAIPCFEPARLTEAAEHPEDILLLVEEKLLPTLPEEILSADSLRLFVLREEASASPLSCPGIFRYQPMVSLLKELGAYPGNTDHSRMRTVRTVGIYAPAPNSLRPAVTRILAEILAEHCQVLCIFLDPFAAVPEPESAGQGLSELLYRRRHSPDHFWTEDLADRSGNLQILPPVQNPEDLWSMTAEESAALLRDLSEQCGAQILIVDLPDGKDPRPVFQNCRHVLLPTDDTPDGRQALRTFREYILLSGQEELLSRAVELILPPCREFRDCSSRDPLMRHGTLGTFLQQTCLPLFL